MECANPCVMATLSVLVKPGVRNPGIRIAGDSVEVRVREPAQEGRANAAVREALADALGIAPSAVVLVRGAAARQKSFEIAGFTRDDVLGRLCARGLGGATSKEPVDGV